MIKIDIMNDSHLYDMDTLKSITRSLSVLVKWHQALDKINLKR
jgi:hypothetical protein